MASRARSWSPRRGRIQWLDVVDAKTALGGPINFAAHVTRKGDIWRLEQAGGSLDGKPFNLPFLQFTEGQGVQPGAVAGELDFPSLSGMVAGRQVSFGSLHVSLNRKPARGAARRAAGQYAGRH